MHYILSPISFLNSYLGLRDRKRVSSFVSNVIIGPIWETLIFQSALLGLPLSYVRRSWDIPWLPDPFFDRALKIAIIVAAMTISNFTFITFHRPGHFSTYFLEQKAKRLLRKVEAAWVWRRGSEAVAPARELLTVSEDMWVREGSEYYRFLQALSLHVLCTCENNCSLEVNEKRRKLVKHILSETPTFPNDVLRPE